MLHCAKNYQNHTTHSVLANTLVYPQTRVGSNGKHPGGTRRNTHTCERGPMVHKHAA